jgi:hypothetical protein
VKAFIPCSRRHGKHCSSWHSSLVQSYRNERHRQEVEFEGLTGGHAADAAFIRAQGHTVITFAEWLRANTSERQHHV